MKKYLAVMLVLSLAIVLFAVPAFSQGSKQEGAKEAQPQAPAAQPPAIAEPAPTPSAAVQEAPKTNELSIYGEVQAVNAQANSLTVQYYDYDKDEEKSMEVTLDKDSKLENAKAIGEIKKGDWVDVTYVTSGGKNVVKLTSVEKEEPTQEENAPTDQAEE